MSTFRVEGQPPKPTAHGSCHDEIGGPLGAVFTSEGDFLPRQGHNFVGLRLVAPAVAPRLARMIGWLWFFKPVGAGPDPMKSTSTAALMCGGFRLTADKEESR
jgi:hypothetical protein